MSFLNVIVEECLNFRIKVNKNTYQVNIKELKIRLKFCFMIACPSRIVLNIEKIDITKFEFDFIFIHIFPIIVTLLLNIF